MRMLWMTVMEELVDEEGKVLVAMVVREIVSGF